MAQQNTNAMLELITNPTVVQQTMLAARLACEVAL